MARCLTLVTLLSISLFVNEDAWARGRRQSRRSGGQSSGASSMYYSPTQPAPNKTPAPTNAAVPATYLAVPVAGATNTGGNPATSYVLVPYNSMPTAQNAIVVYGFANPTTSSTGSSPVMSPMAIPTGGNR